MTIRDDDLCDGGPSSRQALSGRLSRRQLLNWSAVVLGGGALAACSSAESAGATNGRYGSTSPSRTLITVAHADDNLLFMSPDELTLIRDGAAVQVVYLTTGDAGRGTAYWHLREAGAKAATAAMAGVSNRWRRGSIHANGYELVLETLIDAPRLTIVFVRLPDGAVDGSGYADTHYESLKKLWTGEIPYISSADGSRYSSAQLESTLASIATQYRPDAIYTQDFLGYFGDGDHTDHVATGLLTTHGVSSQLAGTDGIIGYQGYPIHALPPNVSGELLAKKEQAFLVYSHYDPDGCTPLAECFAPGLFAATYGSWLERQYAVAKIPSGSTVSRAIHLS
ncbi:MAG: PIG-L family deacetylase [Acidimicrobiales bacterium]